MKNHKRMADELIDRYHRAMLERWEDPIPPDRILGSRMEKAYRDFLTTFVLNAGGFQRLITAIALGGGLDTAGDLETTLRLAFIAGALAGLTGELPVGTAEAG